MGKLKGAVDLVGGDVVEEFAFILLRQGVPVFLSGLKEREGAHDVGAGEGERVFDRTVDMALGGEMDDAVDTVTGDDATHLVKVGDVGLDKCVVRLVLDILEVGKVAGVGQLVKVYNIVFGIFVDKQSDDVRADEAGSAGDEYVTLHFLSGF